MDARVVKGISRVGIQKRGFMYDGRPYTPALDQRVHSKDELTVETSKGTVITIGAVVGSLIALNWYQARSIAQPPPQITETVTPVKFVTIDSMAFADTPGTGTTT